MFPSLGGAVRCDAMHVSAISKPVGYTRSGRMQTPQPIGYRDVPGLSVGGDDQRDLLAVGAQLRGHGRDLGDHLLDVPAQRRAAIGASVEGLLFVDGSAQPTDSGKGADVLGHPFHAVAWLVRHLASQGKALRAGQVVMTGSIVTTKFPQQPGNWRFELAGVGDVHVEVV